MGRLMRTMRERLVSERGSVGVVVALVLFLVMGMLTMTWNTAELSKAKMRLQNAADSAALSHAIWQARGMNAVQNINDEMYDALYFAKILRTAGEWAEGFALGFDAAAELGGPIGIVFSILAKAFHFIGVVAACTGAWIGQKVCGLFLHVIQIFYVYGSSAMGYYNAQLFAAQNEADPLWRIDTSGIPIVGKEFPSFGFYSVGLSWPILDAFVLPLGESKRKEVGESPWKVADTSTFDLSIPPWKGIYEAFDAGKGWTIKPYVSRRGDKEGIEVKKETKDGKETKTVNDNGILPGPTMWVAFKTGDHIHTLPLDGFWNPGDKDRFGHKYWMVAVSSAQCITGDVVPHSKKIEEGDKSQRPAGFGTGATAKLVPVSSLFYKMGEKSGKYIGGAIDAVIYH